MTSGVSLNSIAPVFSSSISSMFHALASKVNGVFGLYLAAVGSLCVYHAYQGYQFFMNPSSQLDDRLKIVKCKILLNDIQNCLEDTDVNNKSLLFQEDLTALVKECEALHNSMTKKDPSVSKGLFEYYLKKDPEQAYQIAEGFSSEVLLFDAFQSLHQANPEFDREKLSSLLNKAYAAYPMRPFYGVKRLLEYVKLAQSLGENELKNKVLQRAINVATELGVGLAQANAWCEIVKVCKDLGIDERSYLTRQFFSFLEQAKKASEDANLPKVDLFKAHLTHAKAYFLCGPNDKTVLDPAYKLFCQGIHQDADLLASLYAELGANKLAEQILDRAFKALKHTPNVDPIAYLRLANAYLKPNVCLTSYKANKALGYAFEAIERLPENTDEEINSIVSLLEQVICWEEMLEGLVPGVVKSLEQLYNKCSFGSFTKKRITLSIFDFCKSKNWPEKSKAFFESYLTGLTSSKLSAFDKINELVHFSTRTLTPEQRTRMLGAAKGFMSQVPSCNDVLAKTIIAEGYLGVDRAISREMIDNYAKDQAWKHLLKAAIPAIVLPIFHAYPMTHTAYRMTGLFCAVVSTIGLFSRT